MRIFWLFLLLLIVPVGLNAQANNQLPYRILYLNSYHSGFSWSDEVTTGINSYFARRDSFAIYTEFMDAKRHLPIDAEKWTLDVLHLKYSPNFFSVIIASDNSALNFVLKFKNDPVLKGVPIVFCGISNPDDYPVEADDLYGVYETDMFVASFDIIKSIYPNFRTVYFFCDRTNTGKVYRTNAEKFLKKYPGYNLVVIDSIYQTSVGDLVRKLPGDAIIYYAGISIDGKGEVIDHFVIARKIFENSKSPVFSSYIVDIKGATGGYYSTGNDHGFYTAQLAEKRLLNRPIEKRVLMPPLAGLYDYNKMELFNIDRHSLPKGSTILNVPQTFFSKYKTLLLWNLLFVSVLVAIIVLLIRVNAIQLRSKQYMEKAMARALESDMLKGAFLANVSHELRTPLNAICGFSELIKVEIDDENLKGYIDVIYSNSELLARLVNDLLDISLIDASAMRIVKRPIDLEQFFQELKQQAESLLKIRNKDDVRVEVITNPLYRKINNDAFRISQVMINFISNAAKYTDTGQITLGYNHQSLLPHYIPENQIPPASLVLYVKDSGIGIDADKQHMVFERFRMVDSMFVSQHGGIGLGLNIAKSLVELMGGVIFVQSEPGKGSIFGCYLPFE